MALADADTISQVDWLMLILADPLILWYRVMPMPIMVMGMVFSLIHRYCQSIDSAGGVYPCCSPFFRKVVFVFNEGGC